MFTELALCATVSSSHRKPGQWGIREGFLCWLKVGKPCRDPRWYIDAHRKPRGCCFVAKADSNTSKRRVVPSAALTPRDRLCAAPGWMSAKVAPCGKAEELWQQRTGGNGRLLPGSFLLDCRTWQPGGHLMQVSSCFTCKKPSRCSGGAYPEEVKDCQVVGTSHSVMGHLGVRGDWGL